MALRLPAPGLNWFCILSFNISFLWRERFYVLKNTEACTPLSCTRKLGSGGLLHCWGGQSVEQFRFEGAFSLLPVKSLRPSVLSVARHWKAGVFSQKAERVIWMRRKGSRVWHSLEGISPVLTGSRASTLSLIGHHFLVSVEALGPLSTSRPAPQTHPSLPTGCPGACLPPFSLIKPVVSHSLCLSRFLLPCFS